MNITEYIMNHPLLGRKESFAFAMEEVVKRWKYLPINILETGTTRKKEHEVVAWDGGSSILFSYWAKITGGQFWTVDISEENINECRRWTEQTKENTNYIAQCSAKFLAEFQPEIHLLFLDSWDTSGNDPNTILDACNHQLREITAIYNNLRPDSLILLDDVRENFKNGKSEYSIPFLLERGWKIILHDKKNQQVLLSK